MYSEMAAFCIIKRICANFPYQCRRALRPTEPPVQWEPGLFPRCKAAGAWHWQPSHPPPSSAEVKERVKVYLYSPSWVFMACYRVKCTSIFTHTYKREQSHSSQWEIASFWPSWFGPLKKSKRGSKFDKSVPAVCDTLTLCNEDKKLHVTNGIHL
jgi:hypothetical protein